MTKWPDHVMTVGWALLVFIIVPGLAIWGIISAILIGTGVV